jgi:hypothetical protein
VDEGIVIVPFVGDMREITVEFVSDKSEWGMIFALGVLDVMEDTHV